MTTTTAVASKGRNGAFEHMPGRVRLQLAHHQLVPEVDPVRDQADQREHVAGQQPADQSGARRAEHRRQQQEEAEQAVEDLAGDIGAGAADRAADPC